MADVLYWFACAAALALFLSVLAVIVLHHGEWRVVALAAAFSGLIWATGRAARYVLSVRIEAPAGGKDDAQTHSHAGKHAA